MNIGKQTRKQRAIRDGFVYFVRAKEWGSIKIGWSAKPTLRFATLASGSLIELELMGAVPATSADEKAVQNKFIGQIIRNEWFASSPELLALIHKALATGALPDDCRGDQHTPSLCRSLTEARARSNRAMKAAA